MNDDLQAHIEDLIHHWRRAGLPSHSGLLAEADRLAARRERQGTRPLWQRPPLLVTATLDDALGQGLTVIHRFADAVGLRRHHLGLTVPAEVVIDACRAEHPPLLGMTVLQFDSEADLVRIRREIPADTRMVLGGPLFRADPDLAARCGVDFVARDAGDFLKYLLDHREALDGAPR